MKDLSINSHSNKSPPPITGVNMSFDISWTQTGEISISGKKANGKFFSAAIMDLTDCGHGYVPHSLHNITELEAVALINKSSYISNEARYLGQIVSELEYLAHEEKKREYEMENREEESCPLCDTFHNDWDTCFSIKEQY